MLLCFTETQYNFDFVNLMENVANFNLLAPHVPDSA